ncbi:hypothetical protein P175DRAFT_0502929 [Aspergillus ochraceoroseus IBT 24754]|uniref:Uncharacterized protein n=1 Tax=Aspergillus ochraceoroseus IBT 24754 TaxID=1392256 RepID=A0A2T5LSY3_9EURO|nr:uncharacterized protein P175DRAFT_0502929 [Aspergillus ochraceoroseus IBT 24754]PTU19389.1 hypothetical protein P175DRAFT_0502929 [Aspergillus ochraceoroseus IBT 24754]
MLGPSAHKSAHAHAHRFSGTAVLSVFTRQGLLQSLRHLTCLHSPRFCVWVRLVPYSYCVVVPESCRQCRGTT